MTNILLTFTRSKILLEVLESDFQIGAEGKKCSGHIKEFRKIKKPIGDFNEKFMSKSTRGKEVILPPHTTY